MGFLSYWLRKRNLYKAIKWSLGYQPPLDTNAFLRINLETLSADMFIAYQGMTGVAPVRVERGYVATVQGWEALAINLMTSVSTHDQNDTPLYVPRPKGGD